MELGLEDGRLEPELDVNLTRGNVPQQHIPVRGGAQQLGPTPVPATERKGRSLDHVTRADLAACLRDVMGWMWQLHSLEMPLVMKSQMAIRPSLQPTAS